MKSLFLCIGAAALLAGCVTPPQKESDFWSPEMIERYPFDYIQWVFSLPVGPPMHPR